ncbi:MAG: FecR domain-containing protein [Akkermansiaceae bacterium]|nr:FecR domain-containing protein [Akkermansiaceae bacterium]
MTPFSNDPDFLDLIAVWHENHEFSDERREELLQRLGSDPELRCELAREIQLAALTDTVQRGESSWLRLEEKLASGEESDTPLPHEDAIMSRIREADRSGSTAKPRNASRRSFWWLGIATAGAVVLLLGLAITLRDTIDPKPGDEISVAKVIRIDGAGRTNQGRILTAGDQLRAGEKLSMNAGLVEMAFLDTGVHVIATAPLAFTTESTDRMFVHDGEVKLHVPPQGIGFVVETLERQITDLGTSFVVTAGENGSEVLVLDGQIAVGDRSGGGESLMFEGDRANFDRDGAINMSSRGPSGVPELRFTGGELELDSMRGRLLAFELSPTANSADRDVIGARVLPLIQSGFQDESCLAGMKQVGPVRFTGVAGTYNEFPRAAGLEPYGEQFGWLTWYRGERIAPSPGRYRFWGYADNHLLVAVDGEPVFEGSRYSSSLREELGIPRRNHPSLPCLNSMAGFASGEWFEVGVEPVRLDLLFGEQGARLTSGLLLIEREGETYEESSWGQPMWPLFLTEPPSDGEMSELENLRRHMKDKLMGSFSISKDAVWNIRR